jgi:hypothetical protein
MERNLLLWEAMTHPSLSTQVHATPESVEVALVDARADAVQTFEALTAPQQEQLAHDAWHVGLRALCNAYRQAEEARLKDIGANLVQDVDEQLRAHAELQEKALTQALARYFDPESGELGTRLQQFIGDEGALARLLEQQLGPRNSVLVETLSQHIGEQSPLFKKLSPTDSEGLIAVLSERLRLVLQQEHSDFQKALDPINQDGAIAKFLERLKQELKQAEDDQAKQLKLAMAALDTTKEDSLLNQLRRETQTARAELLKAINPAAEGSPLAIIQSALTDLLAEHTKSQKEQLEEARKQNAEFQRDVRESIQRIDARRREEQRSTRGGAPFEDLVAAFVQRHFGGQGYVVDATGNVVGLRPNCKVGDVVIELPRDHTFGGSRVVVEAKRDRSFTVTRALEEISTARKNRSANAGLFVLARSHAGPGFPSFARYGHDVLLTWDDEDPSSDSYLVAAVTVALALATRTKSNADEGDLQALQGIEQRIVTEVKRLDKIRDAAKSIKRQADIIEKHVDRGEGKLNALVDDAKRTLTALNVELRDEEAERDAPIEVAFELSDNEVMMAAGAED